MIARDEEDNIGRCLASVNEIAEELIVVDTGSKDRTIEIAEGFGARIIEFPWVDDFSAARNVGVEQARGDWILFLDADEELVAKDRPELVKLLVDSEFDAYFLTLVRLDGDDASTAEQRTFPSVRLFRNRPDHRFSGRVHETVTPARPDAPAGTSSIRVLHHGSLRSAARGRGKGSRNRDLIEKMLEEKGDDSDTLLLKARELLGAGRYEEALKLYLDLYEDFADEDFLGSTMIVEIVQCYSSLGRPSDALSWTQKGLARFPDYTDLQFLAGVIELERGGFSAALAAFTAALALGEPPDHYRRKPGVGTWEAWSGIGRSFLGLERHNVAAGAFRQALKLHPGHGDSLYQLGSLLLRGGHPWEAVRGELETGASKTESTEGVFRALRDLSMKMSRSDSIS